MERGIQQHRKADDRFPRALLSLNKGTDHVRGSAEALRQAALTMLKTPGYSHPLFWAGFIIIGNGW